MQYQEPPILLTDTSVANASRTLNVSDLPQPQPRHPARLADASPLLERIWCIALNDIELSIVEREGHEYFAESVPTRAIALAGVLGINQLYPRVVLDTFKHHIEKGIDIDVGMISCVEHLLRRGADNYEWQWLCRAATDYLMSHAGLSDTGPEALLVHCLYRRDLKTVQRINDLLGRFAHARDWQATIDEEESIITELIPDSSANNPLGMAVAALDGMVLPVFTEQEPSALVATLQMTALEHADGKERTAHNAALLALTVDQDGFHGLTTDSSSNHNLVSAAAFVNVCLRAGLFNVLST